MRHVKKPFSIEAYKTGRYVVTDGRKRQIEIVSLNSKNENEIIAQVKSEDDSNIWFTYPFMSNGQFYEDKPSEHDLILVEEKFTAGDIVVFEKDGTYVGIGIVRAESEKHWSEEIDLLVFVYENNWDYPNLVNEVRGKAKFNGLSYCGLAVEVEEERLKDALKAINKTYDAEKHEIVEIPPVAKVVEYEPIGKCYESSGIEINDKLTKEQKKRIIKALADTI